MNTHDQHFHPAVEAVSDTSIVFAEEGLRKAGGVPDNLKLGKKGTWNDRMFVGPALSMVTLMCDLKRIHPRIAAYGAARLTCVSALHVIIAEFSL